MTKAMYEDFLIAFKQYEQEFYGLRDELVDQYDNMVEEFRSLYCKATGCDEEEWNKIKKMIPTKTQFRDSFKIKLDRAPFVLTSD